MSHQTSSLPRGPLAVLAALFVVVAAGWAWAIPPFEKPDELGHYAYARFVATERRLPVQGADGPWVEAEDQQPPAYYAVAALAWGLARGLGAPDVRPTEARFAPAIDRPDAAPPDRVRYLQPLPPRDRCGHLPCAVLLLRGLSLALFALGLLPLFRIAQATFGAAPGLAIAAAALAAFVPQVTFIATSVSNDGPAAAWAAMITAMLLRPAPADARAARRGAVVLGAMLGLGWMVKSTILPLWPLAVFVRPARGDARPMSRGSLVALVAAVAVVVALPWAARNVTLYGSVLASAEQLRPEAFAWNLRPKSLFSMYFLTQFPWYLSRSAWGVFGMLNAFLPPAVYAIWNAVLLVSATGLWLHAVRRVRWWRLPGERAGVPRSGPWPEGRTLAVLASAIGLTIAGIVLYNLVVTQPQGRYLLPALGPLACAVVLGLAEIAHWVRGVAARMLGTGGPRAAPRWAPMWVWAAVAALAATNVATLAWVVATYYP